MKSKQATHMISRADLNSDLPCRVEGIYMVFVENESLFRLSLFLGVLLIMAVWEMVSPMRELNATKLLRWSSNLGLVVLNALVLRILLPLTAAGAATIAQENGWGFFHIVDIPFSPWIVGLITVIFLDLAVYWQHVLFHVVPPLWRFHLVHHADPDIDVTTGLRFHTMEILISMGLKISLVLALGPPAGTVILFEMVLNSTAMFNHSNVRLPESVDRFLRLFLVTPDMHRVHHSTNLTEANTNFGFNLPWWDRLFRSYRAQPDRGHKGMTIGLSHLHEHRVVRLYWMLLLPFITKPGNEPAGTDLKR